MSVQGLFGLLPRVTFVNRIIKGLSAGVLGLAILGWIIEQSGPRGTAIVHVIEPDVEVIVGGRSFFEDRPFAVIECPLPAGRHVLRMKRGDRILYEEWFTIRRGEDVILTAYCPR